MLKKVASRWEFVTEEALETFLAEHLQYLGLSLLKRQYVAIEDRSDIIAADPQGQVSIIELKNSDDSGLVAQLTRYYDRLIEDRPFSPLADYSLEVKLVAIAPIFKRQNLIDRKYSRLDITLLRHEIHQEGEQLFLMLIDHDEQLPTIRIPIPSTAAPDEQSSSLEKRTLKNILAKWSPEEKTGVLALRDRLLSISKMEETTPTGRVLYERGQKFCAEVRYNETIGQAALFLWLPEAYINHTGRGAIGVVIPSTGLRAFLLTVRQSTRMFVSTDWQVFDKLVYMERGHNIDNIRTMQGMQWDAKADEIKRWGTKSYGIGPLSMYLKHVLADESANRLDTLIDFAINNWKERTVGVK
ncbi:MAG: DUF91 domain-containing protein [Anaerolineae bacterium]|nr:DUF91 domain-containing protein [Gloeobacterales cyanobacterium ES-bin-313]